MLPSASTIAVVVVLHRYIERTFHVKSVKVEKEKNREKENGRAFRYELHTTPTHALVPFAFIRPPSEG